MHRESGNRRAEGQALGNLGTIYSQQRDFRKAIEYMERAMKIQREVGNRRGEGTDLKNLGLVYAQLGQVDKAIGLLEQARGIGQEIKDPQILDITTDAIYRLRRGG